MLAVRSRVPPLPIAGRPVVAAAGAAPVAVDAAAGRQGPVLERVLLAPELVPSLLSSAGEKKLGPLSERPSRRDPWWRHDEHVHLDFRLER